MFLRRVAILLFLPIAVFAQTLQKDAVKDTVVAEFGKDKILMSEFRIAYLNVIKKPNMFDSKKLREQILDEMIGSRLLAGEAKRLGFDNSELLQYRVKAYRDKCLREEHYRKIIKPEIKYSEKELEEAYQYSEEERRISHLFCETKLQADSLYKLLELGVEFEDLAKIAFRDTALANNGGDLGWVYWDQLEYDLGMAAYRLPLNKYSAPIKSQYGYHIIKVTDYKKKPLLTDYEYVIHRNKAKYILESKIGEKLAYDYISKMIKRSKVTLNTEVFEIVKNAIKDKFKRKPNQFDQMSEVQLKDSEVKSIETNLWEERNKAIANINGEELTIADFMGYLQFVPYELIYGSFKKTFDYILRDFIITQEARQMGITDQFNVESKTELFNEYLLDWAFRRTLTGSIKVSEDDIKEYYANTKSDLKKLPLEQVHDIIKDAVRNHKLQEAVPGYIDNLEKNMTVKKNLDVINDFYDGVLKGKINEQ